MALKKPVVLYNGKFKELANTDTTTDITGIVAGGELSGNYPNPTIVNSAVLAKVLTGFISGSGGILSTDSILQAIQKLDGNTAINTTQIGTIQVGNNLFNYYNFR